MSKRKGKVVAYRGAEDRKRHGNQKRKVCYEESRGWEYEKQSGEYGRVGKLEGAECGCMECGQTWNLVRENWLGIKKKRLSECLWKERKGNVLQTADTHVHSIMNAVRVPNL